MENYLQKGAPASKLVLGLPLYGRTFTLASVDSGYRAPVSSGGAEGPYTRSMGFRSYYEVSVRAVYRHPSERVLFPPIGVNE